MPSLPKSPNSSARTAPGTSPEPRQTSEDDQAVVGPEQSGEDNENVQEVVAVEESRSTELMTLPPELIIAIIQFMTPQRIMRLRRVSSQFSCEWRIRWVESLKHGALLHS